MDRTYIYLLGIFFVFAVVLFFASKTTYVQLKVPYVDFKFYVTVGDPFTLFGIALFGSMVMVAYAIKVAREEAGYIDEENIKKEIKRDYDLTIRYLRDRVEELERKLESARREAELARIELQYLKKYALGMREE